MSQIISILLWVLFPSSSFGETILAGSEDYVVRGCVQATPENRFFPVPVEICGNKIYCLNSFVECNFIKTKAIQAGADWKKIIERPNLDWIRFGATIFCKMENNSCNVDLDACANQSAKVAGCSLKNMPGAEQYTTVPRDGAR